MKIRSLLLTLTVFCSLCLPAMGKNPKIRIAVIDMNRVFDQYNKTKINEAKLKKQSEIFQNYARELSASIQKLQREFIRLRDASQNLAYSDAERENIRLKARERYVLVQSKKKELEKYDREKHAQLRDQYEKHRSDILKDISLVVNNKSIAEGYVLVLDKSGRSFNNIPTVVYASGAIDITESVIKILNMGSSPAASSGKSPAKKGNK